MHCQTFSNVLYLNHKTKLISFQVIYEGKIEEDKNSSKK